MVMLVVILRIPRSLPLLSPPPPPPLNWQKEHYPVVVKSDLIGLGVRKSSQKAIKWWC
jgi:hypothetical protein